MEKLAAFGYAGDEALDIAVVNNRKKINEIVEWVNSHEANIEKEIQERQRLSNLKRDEKEAAKRNRVEGLTAIEKEKA